jgi:hypothetical protein
MCAPLDWIVDPSTGRDFEGLQPGAFAVLWEGTGNAGCGLASDARIGLTLPESPTVLQESGTL